MIGEWTFADALGEWKGRADSGICLTRQNCGFDASPKLTPEADLNGELTVAKSPVRCP